MKITDFALIFIAITLPIIIIVYINVSYTIKAEEQEMYYNKLINLAIEDATAEMKQIENDDKEIDYGYSGEEEKKVSVNAQVAQKAFFNSLYNNFEIKGNDAAERYLQIFVPALAIIDYNGVYISSIEEYERNGNTVIEHTVKPKKYYTYTYYILNTKDTIDNLYMVVDAEKYNETMGKITSSHTVEFTMDDYITHRGCVYGANNTLKDLGKWSFYMADTRIGTLVESSTMSTVNNAKLYNGINLEVNYSMIDKIVEHLKSVKDDVIIKTITDELAYSVNANNYYASNSGITYDFVFPAMEESKMGEYINEIGIFAFVQGLSIGNKYLDTQAYSVTRLELVNKYYLSVPSNDSKYNKNLYHSSIKCPEYKVANKDGLIPSFVTTKQQAASVIGKYNLNFVRGFYPCPICRP